MCKFVYETLSSLIETFFNRNKCFFFSGFSKVFFFLPFWLHVVNLDYSSRPFFPKTFQCFPRVIHETRTAYELIEELHFHVFSADMLNINLPTPLRTLLSYFCNFMVCIVREKKKLASQRFSCSLFRVVH